MKDVIESSSRGDIDLRSASAVDALCLSALATQVFLETYAPCGIRVALAREVASHFSVASFLRRLQAPSNRTVLAERDGHLIGFAEVAIGAGHPLVSMKPTAEVVRLYVQSPFLRRGVGSLLLRRCEALSSAEGTATLWLTAWIGNERALAFYASRGYAALGSTDYTFEGESFENRLFAKVLQR